MHRKPAKQLAARTAEAIFTAQITLGDAVAFYDDVKGRMAQFGRAPEESANHARRLPRGRPHSGRGAGEIRPVAGIDRTGRRPVPAVRVLGGVDLSAYPIDGPLPDIPLDTNASKSRRALLVDLARRENLSIRQLYLRIAGARGHWQLVGTPEQIA